MGPSKGQPLTRLDRILEELPEGTGRIHRAMDDRTLGNTGVPDENAAALYDAARERLIKDMKARGIKLPSEGISSGDKERH